MAKKRVHITYDKKQKNWKAEAEGAKRAQARSDTKAELIQKTAQAARRHGDTSVVIHKKDGKIQEERTYPRSKDPHPPKG